MATRKDISVRFAEELLEATEGLVDEQNVVLGHVDKPEVFPVVSYDALGPRDVSFNRASASPDKIIRDEYGNEVTELWRDYQELRFTIYIRTTSQDELETIYNAVRDAFVKYSLGGWDKKDFHPDLHDFGIRVTSVEQDDDTSQEPTVRGDVMYVFVRYFTEYVREEDLIENILVDVLEQEYEIR